MRALVPHPAAPPPAGLAVAAAAELDGAVLRLRFSLTGDLTLASVPARTAARRADRLWERTCFEAFVAPARGERYVELNLSPSTEWAAYAFDGYRRGLRPLELAAPPAVAVEVSPHALVVTASVDLAALHGAAWPWRVGLTAVVASAAGQVSYWALAHPRAKPDFHDAAGWVLTLEGTTG